MRRLSTLLFLPALLATAACSGSDAPTGPAEPGPRASLQEGTDPSSNNAGVRLFNGTDPSSNNGQGGGGGGGRP